MFEILDIFRVVFNYIFWISFGCTCFIEIRKVFVHYRKNSKNEEKMPEENFESPKFIEYVYFILALLAIISGELMALRFSKKLWWLLLILAIPPFT